MSSANGSPSRRVAVVTGAASGIGFAVAQRLTEQGHLVALLDQRGDEAQKAANQLHSSGAGAISCEVDVVDRGAVNDAIRTVHDEFGPVEIIVTRAGIEAFKSVTEITEDEWNRILAINLTGTFHCVQAVIPDMLETGWGRIITISSSSAQSGAPRMAHYVASKGGVIALTKALAVELSAQGITANTIPPSIIDTPMARHSEEVGDFPGVDTIASVTPVRRAGTPNDVAAACAFLCTEEGGFITGQLIGVNGGLYI